MKKKLLFAAFVFISMSKTSSQTWTNYDSSDGVINGIISSMHLDSDGTLWYVDWSDNTSSGIGSFDGTTFEQFGITEGATGNSYQGLIQDNEGNYWFGGFIFDTGLDRFDGTNWTNFTVDDGLGGNNVSDIIIGIDNTIWMTCLGSTGGLTNYDGTTFTNYPTDGVVLPEVSLIRLDQDSSGDFWIASPGGLISFDLNEFTLYTSADGLSDDRIESVLVDSNDIVWAGVDEASGGGLNRFDGNEFTVFTVDDGLPNNSIRAIFEDSLGNIWLGTNMGVSKYDGVAFENYDSTDGLIDDRVRSIVEDDEGNLWFGTWEGISKFNPILNVFQNSTATIHIYPNPASKFLQIESDTPIEDISIYNLMGKLVLNDSEINNDRINISQLNSGEYLILFKDTFGNKSVKKLLVR